MIKDTLQLGKKISLLLLFFISLLFVNRSYCQNNAYALTNAVWHPDSSGNIKISVCWDNPDKKYKDYMALVQDAIINTWQKHSNIQFIEWCSVEKKDCDIHIYISDTVPNTVFLGTGVRHKIHGIVLNFELKNWNKECDDKKFCIRTVAIHEFGHALGFSHEQNRTDCQFNKCLGKEQGEKGNWTLQPCDTFSVMNYCNPKYLNNGDLSPLDVQALQSLYGLPANNANEYKGLRLVYSSSVINPNAKDKEISHEFKVYISGNSKDLDRVDHVLYYLDPNWFTRRQREVSISNDETNYGLGVTVWRPIHLVAFVFIDDGTDTFQEVVLNEDLIFDH